VSSTFVYGETKRFVQAPSKAQAIQSSVLTFAGFGLGSRIERKLLGSKLVRQTRFGDPLAEIQTEREIQTQFKSKGQQAVVRETFQVFKELRVGGAQPVPRKLTAKELPAFLNREQKQIIIRQARKDKAIIFGSLGTQLTFKSGEVRAAGDVDLFVKTAGGKQLKVKGQSIGLGAEKIADIKPVERRAEFPFVERTINLPSGERYIRQTEQGGRKILGFIDPSRRAKKGTKDIDDALKIAQLLLKEQKKQNQRTRASIPLGSPSDRELQKQQTRLTKQQSNIDKFLSLQKTQFGKTTRDRKLAKEPSRVNSFIRAGSRIRSPVSSRYPSPSKSSAPSKASNLLSRLNSRYASNATRSVLGSRTPSRMPSKVPSQVPRSTSLISKSTLGKPSKLAAQAGRSSSLITRQPRITTTTTRRVPKFKFGGETKPQQGKSRLVREFEYNPSLVAVDLGIRGKAKGRSRDVFTGLDIRGVRGRFIKV